MSQPPQTRTKQTCLNNFLTCFNRSQPALEVIDSLHYSLVDECPDVILCIKTEINEFLMSLGVSKASGSDGISVRKYVKETAMHISQSLTKLELFLLYGRNQTLFLFQNLVTIRA